MAIKIPSFRIEMLANNLKEEMLFLANSEKAELKTRFFKSKEGEYGYGDKFIGLSNPEMHAIAKHYHKEIDLENLQILIEDEIHEIRFVALSILVLKFKKLKSEATKAEYVSFYLRNVSRINNWDLVDCSCMYILGSYLLEKSDRTILYQLAQTSHLWSERIAIVSTWYFIKHKQFKDTFAITDILLSHKHDLIHKAMGWMLREVWSKGGKPEVENYLRENISKIPRTTLRYAIEKMDEIERKEFLNLK